MAASIIHSGGKQYEEHLTYEAAPISGLPEGATDICYGRGYRGNIAYEFTIDEADFLDWAEGLRKSHRLRPGETLGKIKKEGPFEIPSYTRYLPEQASSASGGKGMAKIQQGYFYMQAKLDNGFELGYDTATRRAYYYRFTY